MENDQSHRDKCDPLCPGLGDTVRLNGASKTPMVFDTIAEPGRELAFYARKKGISTAEVWARVKKGEVLAQNVAGKVYIAEVWPHEPTLEGWGEASSGNELCQTRDQVTAHSHPTTVFDASGSSLFQESFTHLKELTDELLSAKDEIIAHKQEKIDSLQQKLEAKDRSILQLSREIEDLEILVRSLGQSSEVHRQ